MPSKVAPEIEQQIVVLDSNVVDQIAAGEVVERPAHLVKELVENAIDAGAKSIEVEYDLGGRRVRVTDDGKGIRSGELALALARHATSKIRAADDLWNLSTFGFRGEALASIAAVSRLTMQSRATGEKQAYKVVAEFGKILPVEAVGGNEGTTVIVEDLFENVPARLKFMKTETGEHTQIKATLKAIALANENVEFKLKSKGKVEELWPRAKSFVERAQMILGVQDLYEANGGYQDIVSQTVFASPHEVAGNGRQILVFVQGRWVQDRSLQAAVTEAYRGLLMHGEYPIAVVRLTCPPAEVDVNIHPTKSAVKFRDSQSAFRAVQRPLREALEKAPWATKGMRAQGAEGKAAGASFGFATSEPAKKLSIADLTRPYEAGGSTGENASSAHQQLINSFATGGQASTAEALARSSENFARSKNISSHLGRASFSNGSEGSASSNAAEANPSFEKSPVHSTARFEAPEFNSVQFKQKRGLEESGSEVASEAPTGTWSRLQVLGQAHLTYIVAQDTDRLVLVDQHAAHERVAYEKLMRAWMSGAVDRQNLLIPLTVDLDSPEAPEALMSVAPELEKLGLEIDQSGPRAVAIRSIPVAMKESAIVQALKRLANEILDRGGSFALEHKISDLCATMACHSVVRAGQALSADQMRSLLRQMDEYPLSSFCPHGRPVSVDYPFARLERDFGRTV